ncbi:hypothetical protein C8J57DRAFT_1214194 [Mycena rebaudengoi]|nr:hypothetical protein C8J57DRAFT_1214194 [Mycena rebaudengoi]
MCTLGQLRTACNSHQAFRQLETGSKSLRHALEALRSRPKIIRWLRGYDLSTVTFTLRKQHWLEVTPVGYPDVNAIAEDFFVVKPGKAKVFSNKNPAKLFLGIDNTTYEAILEHFERLDNPEDKELSGYNDSVRATRPRNTKGKGTSRKMRSYKDKTAAENIET